MKKDIIKQGLNPNDFLIVTDKFWTLAVTKDAFSEAVASLKFFIPLSQLYMRQFPIRVKFRGQE